MSLYDRSVSFNILCPHPNWCNTLFNPVIYTPINPKRNQGFSTGLMSLLMLRTKGAVHQSVNGLPSTGPPHFALYGIRHLNNPASPGAGCPPGPRPPSPRCPVSSVPVLLSSAHSLPSLMFPYFGLDGEEWPPNPQQLNPFPCPAPNI